MQEYKLYSWRQEPEDKSDFSFNDFRVLSESVVISKKFDLLRYCPPVENQSSLNSCVGNSIVSALEIRNIVNGNNHVDLSRLFVYYNARVAMNETSADQGCYIRDGMKSLSTFGTCPEELWPYKEENVYVRPSWKSYRESYVNRINAYYRIDASNHDELCSQIELSIAGLHPVVFGVMIWEEFKGCNGLVPMPNVNKNSIGSHAMCIVGFDSAAREFLVRNSWGAGWGDAGYCRMPYDYLKVGKANDFWVLTK